MISLKRQIDEELADAKTPLQREVAVSRARSKVCAQAWAEYPNKNEHGIAVFRFGRREVQIGHVQYVEEKGIPAVLIWHGKPKGPPAYRIINPPVMVPDSHGSVEVSVENPGRGTTVRRYKGDPVEALAHAICGR